MAWLSGWTYIKKITLSRASGAVTNYQMKLLVGESSGATGEDVDCGGHALSSFNDIRFTNSDGQTLLDYWIESITGTTPNRLATVWIEFDSIGTGATTFYMYYGKADASSVSSIFNTFLAGDDFSTSFPQLVSADAKTGALAQNNSGDIVVIYKKASTGDICQRTSTDGGLTWSAESTLVSGSGVTIGAPHLSGIGDSLFLSYIKLNGAVWDVKFRKSTNGGDSWGDEVAVVASRFVDSDILALSTSTILIASISSDQTEIVVYRSTDGGDTWGSLSTVLSGGSNKQEDVCFQNLSGGNILIAWEEEVAELGKSYIRSKKSSDSGASWGSVITIWNAEDGNYDYEHSGFFFNDEGNLISAVYTNVDEVLANCQYENYKIKYKKSTDSGATWGSSADLIADTRGIGPDGGCYKLADNHILIFHDSIWLVSPSLYVTRIDENLTTADVPTSSSRWSTGNGKIFVQADSGNNIVQAQGYVTGDTKKRCHIPSSHTGTNYAVRARMKAVSPVTNSRFTFRYTDVDNHYLFVINTTGSIIYKDVTGTYTALDTQSWGGVASDVWTIADILLSGDSIKALVDGTQRHDISDSVYGSGYTGLSAGLGSTDSPVYFDWFFVRQYLATEPAWGSWGVENTWFEDSLVLAPVAGIGNGSQTQFNSNFSLGVVSAISESSIASFMEMMTLSAQAITFQGVAVTFEDVLNFGAISSINNSAILQAINNLNLSGKAEFTPSAMLELFSSLGLNASALLLFFSSMAYLDMVNLSADAKIDVSDFIKRVVFEYEKLKLKVLSPGTEGSFSYEKIKSENPSPGIEGDFQYKKVT